jgi:hypothetical protein
MMILLASREVRRFPALLLLACLLGMGARVATSSVRVADRDGMSAQQPAQSQLVRGTAVRAAAPGGHLPIALLPAGPVLLAQRVVRGVEPLSPPAEQPRPAPRPSYLSRAPPASA